MIQSEDLTKYFGTFKAVEGISLEIYPGEVLALLGQNGAGKTTTVRMLTSMLAPTRGWAKVAGYDVVRDPDKVRASTGVLTEQHGLYGRMTGFEYLDFFGQIYGLDNELRLKRTNELLEYFGLGAAAHRRSGEYSKGMRQKLALARALIHEPPVLLLDEPTSAMDPESAQLVRNEIASLRSSQRTIVICSHNLIEAEMLADKIAIIYHGRILLKGTLNELRERLLGPVEYEVKLSGRWKWNGLELPQGVNVTEKGKDSFRYTTENPREANPLILKQLIQSNVLVTAMQEVPRTLEMIYLKAMAQAAEGLL
jgi:ABC-2 type transport system ATP-binding protein